MNAAVRMTLVLLALVIGLGGLAMTPAPVAASRAQPPKAAKVATVTEHDDGDKLFVRVGDTSEHVHLIGTDAPEINKWECLSFEAADRVRELLPVDTEVYVETGKTKRDKDDRLYAYVWFPLNGRWELLNQLLVREGLAGYEKPATGNAKYDDELKKASAAAKKGKDGVFGACGGNLHNDDEKFRCLPVSPEVVAALESLSYDSVWAGAFLRGARAVRSPAYVQVYAVAADIEGPGMEGDDQVGVWFLPVSPTSLDGISLLQAAGGFAESYTPSLEEMGFIDSVEFKGYNEAIDCVKDGLKEDEGDSQADDSDASSGAPVEYLTDADDFLMFTSAGDQVVTNNLNAGHYLLDWYCKVAPAAIVIEVPRGPDPVVDLTSEEENGSQVFSMPADGDFTLTVSCSGEWGMVIIQN